MCIISLLLNLNNSVGPVRNRRYNVLETHNYNFLPCSSRNLIVSAKFEIIKFLTAMEESAPRGRGRGRSRGGFGNRSQHKRPPPSDYFESEETGGGFSKKRKIMDDVFRFLVPEYLVKSVIGKGGENIKQIKDEASNAKIDTKVSIYAQGANGVPLMDRSKDRVMSVQTSFEGLHMALESLAPLLQRDRNKGQGAQKMELRLLVPAHCCSAIIGKNGSVIKKIKDETKSYIQVYTLPLPYSDEHVVRIQNFEQPDLIITAVKVFESIAEIKGKSPIVMYDPVFFEHGEFGDTGSYIDTDWYQAAIKAGTAKPTPFKAVKAALRQQNYGGSYNHGPGYDAQGYGYEEDYEDPYAYGDGYDSYDYDYEDPYYAPPPPRSRPAPRSRGRSRGFPPSRGSRGMTRPGRGGGTRGRGSRGAPRQPIPSQDYEYYE